ncbi:cinnamoyl-coa reductase 2, partial [Quercus suber]
GFLASWLVKLLLSNNYIVHATVRQPGDVKNAHLSEFENASTNLRLFKAELLDYDSICSAVEGCIGVFHVASPVPVPKTTVEVIEPAVKGTLNVLNWNPAFELDSSPFRENASIRNFDSERAGYVANVVEQVLLLPKEIDELWNLKKHELFLFVKKELVLDKESKRYAAQKFLTLTDKKLKETLLKLAECDKARKSAKASIESPKGKLGSSSYN